MLKDNYAGSARGGGANKLVGVYADDTENYRALFAGTCIGAVIRDFALRGVICVGYYCNEKETVPWDSPDLIAALREVGQRHVHAPTVTWTTTECLAELRGKVYPWEE